MPGNPLLAALGVEHPIICAPMGGGPSTPELVAAVCNAGGLGTLAGAYLEPPQIRAAIRSTRELTSRPFAVNLFAGGWRKGPVGGATQMLNLMRPIHDALGIGPPEVPEVGEDPFPAQLEAVLEERPRAFSFTFGIPDQDAMRRLRAASILTMGTATTRREALLLSEAGVDAIVAQGEEAGAHRGTFTGDFAEAMVPALELVRQTAGLMPVIASGAIMDGRDIAAALAAGALAVQMGTAFLACPESGASAAYKQALLAATQDRTLITRAFSGRPARGLRNEFVDLMENNDAALLPYPWQNALTKANARGGRKARRSTVPVSVGRPGRCPRASHACGGTDGVVGSRNGERRSDGGPSLTRGPEKSWL